MKEITTLPYEFYTKNLKKESWIKEAIVFYGAVIVLLALVYLA